MNRYNGLKYADVAMLHARALASAKWELAEAIEHIMHCRTLIVEHQKKLNHREVRCDAGISKTTRRKKTEVVRSIDDEGRSGGVRDSDSVAQA